MVAFAPDCSSEVSASLHNPKVPSSSPGPNFNFFWINYSRRTRPSRDSKPAHKHCTRRDELRDNVGVSCHGIIDEFKHTKH